MSEQMAMSGYSRPISGTLTGQSIGAVGYAGQPQPSEDTQALLPAVEAEVWQQVKRLSEEAERLYVICDAIFGPSPPQAGNQENKLNAVPNGKLQGIYTALGQLSNQVGRIVESRVKLSKL